MSTFLSYLSATVLHPLGITAMLAALITGAVIAYRVRRLGHIISELKKLPADGRRYVLERQHKIYPGSDKPIAFVVRRRQRKIGILALAVILPAGGIVGVAGYQTKVAESATWEFDDSQITPEGHGYVWCVELVNSGPRDIVIDRIILHISNRSRHKVTDRKWPGYRHENHIAAQVMLRPEVNEIPIVNTDIALDPNESRMLPIGLLAEHDPNEGWIYAVRLEFQWYVPDRTSIRSRFGNTFQVGWPGMPHWSDPDSTDADDQSAVPDPAIRPGS